MADVSVRAAAGEDAAAIAGVQAAAWRTAYVDLLPGEVLDALDSPEALAAWQQAATAPPTPRHRVLVAVAGADVVGFAAMCPAEDPDLAPAVDAELLTLCVAPPARGHGHGSRLVNATVDHLRGDGFRHVHTWLPVLTPGDEELRLFLTAAGWGFDGASRSLDLRGDGEVVVPQERLGTAIGPDE